MTDPDPKANRRAAKAAWIAKERARLKEQGLVAVTVWVRPEDREAVKAYAGKLAGWRESLNAAKARQKN